MVPMHMGFVQAVREHDTPQMLTVQSSIITSLICIACVCNMESELYLIHSHVRPESHSSGHQYCAYSLSAPLYLVLILLQVFYHPKLIAVWSCAIEYML